MTARLIFATLIALAAIGAHARSPDTDARAAIAAFAAHCFDPRLTSDQADRVFGLANNSFDFFDLDPFSAVAPSPPTERAPTPGTDRRCEVSFHGDYSQDAVTAVTDQLRRERLTRTAPVPTSHETLRTDGTALLAARRLNPRKIAVVHIGTRRGPAGGIETFMNVERLVAPEQR